MIVIIVPKGLSIGVIFSQILNLATELSKHKKTVVAFNQDLKGKVKEEQYDFEIQWYATSGDLKPLIKNAEWVHIRAVRGFLRYYTYKKLSGAKYKIFYDFRGLVHEESWYKRKSVLRMKMLFFLEKLAFREADCVGAVSNKLKFFLQKKFGVKRPVYVVPCCIQTVREELINKRETNDDVIRFVYTGGTSKWQRVEDMLGVYKKISKEVNSSLTILTKEVEEAKMLVEKAGLNGVKIESLPQDKVLEALPSFDFGFLIRHNVVMNNVASPIKFLEYVSNGVIPIMTDGIGDYSGEIHELGAGIVLDDVKLDLSKEEVLKKWNDKSMSEKLRQFSRGYLWDHFIHEHPMLKNSNLI